MKNSLEMLKQEAKQLQIRHSATIKAIQILEAANGNTPGKYESAMPDLGTPDMPETPPISATVTPTPGRKYKKKHSPHGFGRFNKKWAPEEEQRMITLYTEGAKPSYIAKIMDRTTPAVSSHLTVLRNKGKVTFQRNPWTPEEEQRLITLHNDGVKIPQIAKLMGKTYSAITSHLTILRQQNRITHYVRKFKTPPEPSPTPSQAPTFQRRPWTPEENRMLEGMWTRGYHISRIAKRINRTENACYRMLRILKVPHRHPVHLPNLE